MRVLVASDAWKGTLPPYAAARALAAGVRSAIPNVEVRALGIADGGEHTLDVLAAAGVLRMRHGIGWDAAGQAWIESARLVGLADPRLRRTPLGERGTHALGRVLRRVHAQVAKRIHVTLGGTATLDLGFGMLLALGAQARDAAGTPVPPTMTGMRQCRHLDIGGVQQPMDDLVALCDVAAPLFGEEGAVRRFGPQKGLAPEEVEAVERDATRFADLAEAAFGRHVRTRPGSGAAGGLGWMSALLGGELQPGAWIVLRALDFASKASWADLVVVAEGRADAQTLQGKAPWIAACIAREQGARVFLLAAEIRDRALFAKALDGMAAFADAGISLQEGLQDPVRALARLGAFWARHVAP